MTGYHGTAYGNVPSILKDQFVTDERDDHWLGQGIYFYDDLDLARWWIETKLRCASGCAVIEASLCCQEIEYLDLDHFKGLDFYFRELGNILDNLSISLRFKDDDEQSRIRNLCFSLDLLKNHLGLKLVTMTFYKPLPRYAEGNIKEFQRQYFPLPKSFSYKERQICASTNDIILSKKCVHSVK
ncbi:MAG: hypothetical protein LH618_19300 [Saprospiraceae bacterium]|nr:hypothetical protein [Saprospiraceae bacterium]